MVISNVGKNKYNKGRREGGKEGRREGRKRKEGTLGGARPPWQGAYARKGEPKEGRKEGREEGK
jgi:hypothetical protein